MPHAEQLRNFTDSVVRRDEATLDSAREALQAVIGDAGLVDAAAVVGGFERMTRVADATGIPLDAPVNALSADIQEELGLRGFRSAAASARPSAVAATVARFLRPVAFRVAAAVARRAQH